MQIEVLYTPFQECCSFSFICHSDLHNSSVVPVLNTGTKIIPVPALFIPVPVLELELELEP